MCTTCTAYNKLHFIQHLKVFTLGLSLHMHHNFRSLKAVSLLNRCGAGVSYDRVTKISNKIANAVSDNIKQFGVYVPPGLLINKRICASMDNIDKKVDTPDGKSSFHGMALGVYQRSGGGVPSMESQG